LKKRGFRVQYVHEEPYSNDLNIDFYSVKINKYPIVNGIRFTPEELIKYIRLNFRLFYDHKYAGFEGYSVADQILWESNNPLSAVIKIDIYGPDNASVVVSQFNKLGWTFSTVKTPNTGEHPVSGHRAFFINKHVDGNDYFVVKGLDMLSSGILQGTNIPTPGLGSWNWPGYTVGDKLWKSMQHKIIKFIDENEGSAEIKITKSLQIGWRYVYSEYLDKLQEVFGTVKKNS
jgi:hypothetical protein